MKDTIIKLRQEGKSLTQIAKAVGCSRSTVVYHLGGESQRRKNAARQTKHRNKHPFFAKLDKFSRRNRNNYTPKPPTKSCRDLLQTKVSEFNQGYDMKQLKLDEVITKFGDNTRCYLTGTSIDIYQPRTYEFDHIIPVSRGGSNTLDNLGICTKAANRAKGDMTHEEFIQFCRNVISHNDSA